MNTIGFRKNKILSLFLVAIMVMGLFFNVNIPASSADTVRGLGTVTRTQEELREYYRTHPVKNLETKFAQEPSITAPYSLGQIDEECLQDALNLLNMYRLIAGLEPTVITPQAQEYAQAAALACAIKNTVSHSPGTPSDMDSELRAKCAYGAFNCNLAGGSGTLVNTLRRFMIEANGDRNFLHRRQLLKQDMPETGFGAAISETGVMCSSAYVNASLYENKVISYPGENQPLEFFGSGIYSAGYVWTVLVPESVDEEKVLVTITDTKTGKVWEFSLENDNMRIDNGSTTYLMFCPEDIYYHEGDKYHVDITGLSTPISYDVNMFLLGDRVPVESVHPGEGETYVVEDPTGEISSYREIELVIYPQNATNKTVTWESSDSSVAYPIYGGPNSCRVVALKPGETVFTGTTEDGGFKKNFKIIVCPKPQEIEMDSEYTVGVGQTKNLHVKALPITKLYYGCEPEWGYDKDMINVERYYNGDIRVTGLKKGTTDLTVYCFEDYRIRKTCRINVVDPVYIDTLSFEQEYIELFNGETEVQLSSYLNMEPANATIKDLYWEGSYGIGGEVDQNGLVTFEPYNALDYNQPMYITVRALDGSEKNATCIIQRHYHNVDSVTKIPEVPATCEKDGVESYMTCICGKMLDKEGNEIDKPIVIPATGHKWDTKYTVDKEATCTEDGVESIHCVNCNETKEKSERIIEKKQHDYQYTVIKEATCTEEGEREKECKVCGQKEKENIELISHRLVEYDESEPDCVHNGHKKYWKCRKCNKCFLDEKGKNEVDYEEISTKAKGHVTVLHEGKDATCTDPGTKTYWECSVCGKKYTDEDCKNSVTDNELEIKKLGHEYSYVSRVNETCTQDGIKAHYKCSRCEKLFSAGTGRPEVTSEELVIKATGHYLDYQPANEATVKYDGNKEYWYCTDCNHLFADPDGKKEITLSDVFIPALGQKDISVCNISCPKEAAWDGWDQTPPVVVKDGSKVLKEGSDYKLTYTNNVNPGTATVTITGTGGYKGSVKKTFSIRRVELKYRAYVQKHGWMKWINALIDDYDPLNERFAGTTDNLRMETIQMSMSGIGGEVKYRAYCAKKGWTQWATTKDKTTYAGTKGESRRIEMIQIQTTGQVSRLYDIYFRTYCEKFGWLGWARSNEKSGSAGYARKLEAFKIQFVLKGTHFDRGTRKAFYDKSKDGANPQ